MYKRQAKVKADEVYARLQAGEDFDTLMNEFSEDPGLQQEPDGYVFTKNQMDPAFEEAAYALQVGPVSYTHLLLYMTLRLSKGRISFLLQCRAAKHRMESLKTSLIRSMPKPGNSYSL